jgi:hypothetical protein
MEVKLNNSETKQGLHFMHACACMKRHAGGDIRIARPSSTRERVGAARARVHACIYAAQPQCKVHMQARTMAMRPT